MKSFINLKNISLDFPVYEANSLSIRNTFKNVGRDLISRSKISMENRSIVKGLTDINLSIKHGDKVALLGSNGSGKTTLLKLIAGIYSPTLGNIEKKGKINCMLDIGFGFEPDATGYENIYLTNIFQGIQKKDIDIMLSEIEEFSGLGEFLNMPFRTYSSGMQARLAFSCAVANSPEILLIDEFFSTGDKDFLKKSEKKVLEMMSSSSILIFASHNLEMLKKICDKGILIKDGKVDDYGEINNIIEKYIDNNG